MAENDRTKVTESDGITDEMIEAGREYLSIQIAEMNLGDLKLSIISEGVLRAAETAAAMRIEKTNPSGD